MALAPYSFFFVFFCSRRSLLSGRHDRQHLLGGRGGGVGTAGKSFDQSTGNWPQDRF